MPGIESLYEKRAETATSTNRGTNKFSCVASKIPVSLFASTIVQREGRKAHADTLGGYRFQDCFRYHAQ